jgi:hypothetical protein
VLEHIEAEDEVERRRRDLGLERSERRIPAPHPVAHPLRLDRDLVHELDAAGPGHVANRLDGRRRRTRAAADVQHPAHLAGQEGQDLVARGREVAFRHDRSVRRGS